MSILSNGIGQQQTAQTAFETAKPEADALIQEISRSFDQARRHFELTRFELEDAPTREQTSSGNLQAMLSRAEHLFVPATSLSGDLAWCGEMVDKRELDDVRFHEDHFHKPDIQYRSSQSLKEK